MKDNPDKWNILVSCENDDCDKLKVAPLNPQLDKNMIKSGETLWGFSKENPENLKSSHANIEKIWRQKDESINGKKLNSSKIKTNDFYETYEKGSWNGDFHLLDSKFKEKETIVKCLNEQIQDPSNQTLYNCLGYVVKETKDDNKLEEYSKGVQARIGKLTRKLREAERR